MMLVITCNSGWNPLKSKSQPKLLISGAIRFVGTQLCAVTFCKSTALPRLMLSQLLHPPLRGTTKIKMRVSRRSQPQKLSTVRMFLKLQGQRNKPSKRVFNYLSHVDFNTNFCHWELPIDWVFPSRFLHVSFTFPSGLHPLSIFWYLEYLRISRWLYLNVYYIYIVFKCPFPNFLFPPFETAWSKINCGWGGSTRHCG